MDTGMESLEGIWNRMVKEDGDAISRANKSAQRATIQKAEADLAVKKSALTKQKALILDEDAGGAMGKQLAELVQLNKLILVELRSINKSLS